MKKRKKASEPREPVFIGIDGEGIGRAPHRYVMLCAATDKAQDDGWELTDMRGLGTVACLDFILGLPRSAKIFGFAFTYDLTKILEDVPDGAIHKLLRPELRARSRRSKIRSPHPVALWLCSCNALVWNQDSCPKCEQRRTRTVYKLNFQAGKFSVSEGKRRAVVWDVFRFYACKFTKALSDWKALDPEAIAKIEAMKAKRGVFSKRDAIAMTDYCLSECRSLAGLVRKLVRAHDDAGLELKSFYGAGSTGAAILTQLGIDKLRKEPPDEMRLPVSCAFFGGRFEHSVIGSVEGPVYSYDISSAYPYQTTFLPCLKHGKWTHTDDRVRVLKARHALVEYRYKKPIAGPWAPLPFRTEEGSIVFPSISGGGWVWRDEFDAAQALFPKEVSFVSAWVLDSRCKCQPFKMIPRFYLNRIRLGKEGAGIVLKLGPNSVYGKLAQSVGQPPFQSWVWAGMITSGTRAQLLQLLALHKDKNNVLAMATDGVYSREDIAPPEPRETGTAKAFGPSGETVRKPLGGWEKKVVHKGVFFARPGVYFPLNPTEGELDAVRARGIGRAAMHKAWQKLVSGYESRAESVKLCELDRFIGCKSAIWQSKKGYVRSDDYGQWIKRPVELSLSPLPKRSVVVARHGRSFGLLSTRAMDPNTKSAPYNRSVMSAEARELLSAGIELQEQPDGEVEPFGDDT